jgi:hypothetical protein
MAILSNPRHEKFAELLAAGKTAREAYVLCGYHDNRHNAARLKSTETVRQRVLELTRAAAAAHEISIASVCRELDEAIQLAKAKGQPNALINAATLRSRLGGLLVDKAEVTVNGNRNEFEDRRDFDEICKALADGQLDGLTNARWLPITAEDRAYLTSIFHEAFTEAQHFLDSVNRRPLSREGVALLTERDVKPTK